MEPGGIQSSWMEPGGNPVEVLLRGTLRESIPGLVAPRAFELQPTPSVTVQQPPTGQMWCQPYEPTPDHVPQSDDDDNWPGPDEISEWSREHSQFAHHANLAATVLL